MKTQFKPILFSTPMVQAILEGRKTQTRRIIKPTSKKGCYGIQIERNMQGQVTNVVGYDEHERTWDENGSPYRVNNKYRVDDILWVRETYQIDYPFSTFCYKADNVSNILNKWKPSIFMPKEAARIFQKVINVRVEKLQDISEEDAIAEGVLKDVELPVANFKTRMLYRDYTNKTAGCADARTSFMTLWKSINGEQSWSDNPYVWVYEFEKVEKPENFK